MKIRYIGQFAEVLIPAAGLVAKRGAVVEVADDVGAGLLAQGAPLDGSAPGTEFEAVAGGVRPKPAAHGDAVTSGADSA